MTKQAEDTRAPEQKMRDQRDYRCWVTPENIDHIADRFRRLARSGRRMTLIEHIGESTSDWEMTGPIYTRDMPGDPADVLDVLLEQARTAHPHADEIIAEAWVAPDLDTLAADDTPVASARRGGVHRGRAQASSGNPGVKSVVATLSRTLVQRP